MKRILMLAGFVLGAAAAHAAPPGVNLSWDECGAAGALNRDFACDTNEGFHALVASLVAPDVGDQVVAGFSCNLDVYAGPSSVPAWWQVQPSTGCRAGSLSLELAFGGSSACTDIWVGQPTGYVSAGVIGSHLRIGVATALDPTQQGPLIEGAEYYLFRLMIDHANTSGAGACSGCPDTARIVLSEVVVQFPLGTMDTSFPSTRNYVLWQQSIVPVRPTSWSSIKQLYR